MWRSAKLLEELRREVTILRRVWSVPKDHKVKFARSELRSRGESRATILEVPGIGRAIHSYSDSLGRISDAATRCWHKVQQVIQRIQTPSTRD